MKTSNENREPLTRESFRGRISSNEEMQLYDIAVYLDEPYMHFLLNRWKQRGILVLISALAALKDKEKDGTVINRRKYFNAILANQDEE